MTDTKTHISDTNFKSSTHPKTLRTFGNVSNYKVGEMFEIDSSLMATKLAEIKIETYKIQGKADTEYTMSIVSKPDAWDYNVDTSIVLEKILNELKNATILSNYETCSLQARVDNYTQAYYTNVVFKLN